MPQKKKRRLSRGNIAAIITAALAGLVAAALLITNIFLPVKYLSAYFSYGRNANPRGDMRVSFIDVGNSECTIVELPDGKNMLIDGGDGTYSHNLKILKELNVRGIDKIDYFVLTSVANESAGGVAEILKYKTVEKVFAPYCPVTYISDGFKKFSDEADKQGIDTEICEYGTGVKNVEAGYFFAFLSPDIHTVEGGEYDKMNSDPNDENIKNASAVMWLEYGQVSFLLLGDALREVQAKLLAAYELGAIGAFGSEIDLQRCSILKLSDHGSSEGAYPPLVGLANPQAAIISVGDNGRGCPTLDALASAQNTVGKNIYRTDECGTVTVTVTGGEFGISKEKI